MKCPKCQEEMKYFKIYEDQEYFKSGDEGYRCGNCGKYKLIVPHEFTKEELEEWGERDLNVIDYFKRHPKRFGLEFTSGN